MGWGHGIIGGKEVGYSVSALCDHEGCTNTIHRGLAYACGGDHGEDEVSCAGYFCDDHRQGWARQPWHDGRDVEVCTPCEKAFRENYPAMAAVMDEE